MPTLEQIQPYTPYIIMGLNGLIAGWLAGSLLGGGGLLRNLVVGIIGAFVGGLLVALPAAAIAAGGDEFHRCHTLWHADPDLDHRRDHRDHRRALPRRPLRETAGPMRGRNGMATTLLVGLALLAASALADDARECVQDRDPDLAIRACSEMIRADARNPVPYNHRGNAHRAKGKLDEAIADHSKAIEIDPRYAMAFSNRCADFVRKPDPDRAVADCTKAIELNPKYPAAYFNRGLAYERKGAYEQAIADQSKAIEISPKYARAYNARAWAYMKAGKARLGLPDVEKALELRPDDAAALDTRGHILEKLGKRKEAIEDFRRALAKDPTLPESIAALKRLRVKQ